MTAEAAGAGPRGAPIPVEVAVSRLEAELAAFWSDPDEAGGSRAQKVRAATMNFVVVAGGGDLDPIRSALDALSETHAGRTFVLTEDADLAPLDTLASVHAECRLAPGGEAPVCFDRIEIAFGGAAAARAASVVGALGLPEVPLVVEAAAGAPATIVDGLLPRCDRLVVDSVHTGIARIAALARAHGAPIADRAFVRTYSWRDLVARFFDESPAAARAIRRVEVARTRGGPSDGAALLVGWLGSRLGWRFEALDRAVDAAGRGVAIAVRDDVRADLPGGALTAVRIDAELGGAPLRLACERAASSPGALSWSMQGARSASHEHALGFRDEGWVLVKALDDARADRVYREAVLAADAWLARAARGTA